MKISGLRLILLLQRFVVAPEEYIKAWCLNHRMLRFVLTAQAYNEYMNDWTKMNLGLAPDIDEEFLICTKGTKFYKLTKRFHEFQRKYRRFLSLKKLNCVDNDIYDDPMCSLCQKRGLLFACNMQLKQCSQGCYSKVIARAKDERKQNIKQYLKLQDKGLEDIDSNDELQELQKYSEFLFSEFLLQKVFELGFDSNLASIALGCSIYQYPIPFKIRQKNKAQDESQDQQLESKKEQYKTALEVYRSSWDFNKGMNLVICMQNILESNTLNFLRSLSDVGNRPKNKNLDAYTKWCIGRSVAWQWFDDDSEVKALEAFEKLRLLGLCSEGIEEEWLNFQIECNKAYFPLLNTTSSDFTREVLVVSDFTKEVLVDFKEFKKVLQKEVLQGKTRMRRWNCESLRKHDYLSSLLSLFKEELTEDPPKATMFQNILRKAKISRKIQVMYVIVNIVNTVLSWWVWQYRLWLIAGLTMVALLDLIFLKVSLGLSMVELVPIVLWSAILGGLFYYWRGRIAYLVTLGVVGSVLPLLMVGFLLRNNVEIII